MNDNGSRQADKAQRQRTIHKAPQHQDFPDEPIGFRRRILPDQAEHTRQDGNGCGRHCDDQGKCVEKIHDAQVLTAKAMLAHEKPQRVLPGGHSSCCGRLSVI
jgi:hypothetical protein